MNPPLRGREDREALRQAVADGTIEVIATDHAPHTAEQKSRGLAGSAMGIVGLECAFPLLYTYLVKPGLLTLEQLVERMSMAPRRIFGLGGGLQAGEPADLTVFDLDAEYEIDPETFLSKGRATPLPAGGLRAVRSGRWSEDVRHTRRSVSDRRGGSDVRGLSRIGIRNAIPFFDGR